VATYKQVLNALKSGQYINCRGRTSNGVFIKNHKLSYHSYPNVSEKTLTRLIDENKNIIRATRKNDADVVFYRHKKQLSGALAPYIVDKIKMGHDDWEVLEVREIFGKYRLKIYDQNNNELISFEIKINLEKLLFLE